MPSSVIHLYDKCLVLTITFPIHHIVHCSDWIGNSHCHHSVTLTLSVCQPCNIKLNSTCCQCGLRPISYFTGIPLYNSTESSLDTKSWQPALPQCALSRSKHESVHTLHTLHCIPFRSQAAQWHDYLGQGVAHPHPAWSSQPHQASDLDWQSLAA